MNRTHRYPLAEARALYARNGEVAATATATPTTDVDGAPLGVETTTSAPALLCAPASVLGYSHEELVDDE